MTPRKRGKGKSVTLTFGDTRAEQVRVQHLFDALLGRAQTPTCPSCGGTLNNVGPTRAHCICTNTETS